MVRLIGILFLYMGKIWKYVLLPLKKNSWARKWREWQFFRQTLRLHTYYDQVLPSEKRTFRVDFTKGTSKYNVFKTTRWHLVTVEKQKCDFLNNQERYEHTVLFCLKVLFPSIFNHNVNDFWEDYHFQFLIFQKFVLRNFSA